MDIKIPFCKPDFGELERVNVDMAIQSGYLEGGGAMSVRSEDKITSVLGCERALITPSCTAALEMMALAMDIQPGDEVIMPAFTFVSTANAFALRGAVPVFVDICPHTLNVDPAQVAAAITERSKAVMVVHYAGVSCDMEALMEICAQNDILLLEDAAQAYGGMWNDRPLGSIGAMGAFSFHHTKNITCGEGGALIINDSAYLRPCEIIQEKGTDRADFLKGIVAKYEWQALGSSYLISEVSAAVLCAQLEREEDLTRRRLHLWERYHNAFGPLNSVDTPTIPEFATHNGHIYYIRFRAQDQRDACVRGLREQGIVVASHFIPLHLTPAGQTMGRAVGDMAHTIAASETLMRLPIYSSMTEGVQDEVISAVMDFITAL